MQHRLRIFVLAVLLTFSVTPLQAHPNHRHGLTTQTHVHGLWSGLVHPFTGVDHLLAMLAVGVLSVQVGGQGLWAGPLSFLGGILLGGVVGSFLQHFAGVEIIIAVSLLPMGMALALSRVPPHVYLYVTFAIFGAFHGFAHVQANPLNEQALNYMTGFIVGSTLLHAAGLMFGLLLKNSQNALFANVPRLTGVGIAAAGLFLMLKS